MTTESTPRIKITYATLRADNEDLHAQFEAGLATVRSELGGHHHNYFGGAWREGDGTFEVRTPIDTSVLVGTFAKATVANAKTTQAKAKTTATQAKKTAKKSPAKSSAKATGTSAKKTVKSAAKTVS